MKKNPVLSIVLLLALVGCASPTVSWDDSRSCPNGPNTEAKTIKLVDGAIPAVAKELYREHLWYTVFTRPQGYFDQLERLRNDSGVVKILAVGDSWFAYPKNFLFFDFLFDSPSNILTNLANTPPKARYILSLSNSGELVANMAGMVGDNKFTEEAECAEQREVPIPAVITRSLEKARDMKSPFDFVLVSGGGNDLLIKKRIKTILKKCSKTDSYDKCFDEDALTQYIARVGSAYKKIIEIVTSIPGYESVKVVAHTYDNFLPQPKGAVFFGGLYTVQKHGWLYRALAEFKMVDDGDERGSLFAKRVVCELRKELLKIEKSNSKNFVVVDTTGTFEDAVVRENHSNSNLKVEDFWLNEIHPTSTGFKLLSEKINSAVEKLLASGQQEAHQIVRC